MKNIVFDLGGVVFARDRRKCTQELVDFFSFVRAEKMPEFWEEYDRGALTMEQVITILCERNGCSRAKCEAMIHESIDRQEAVASTEALIGELKSAGYPLYVLSNMSREYIDFLRRTPVYTHFDGEVVSCEEHEVKPYPRIYKILLSRFDLIPSETLFVDDRAANIATAQSLGIQGYLFDHGNPNASCDALRGLLL